MIMTKHPDENPWEKTPVDKDYWSKNWQQWVYALIQILGLVAFIAAIMFFAPK